MSEVIAGRIDFAFIALGAALPHIRAGKLVALAVNGGRDPSLPDVPTLRQAGFTDAEYLCGSECRSGGDAASDRREIAARQSKRFRAQGSRKTCGSA
jgi:hypothetical protein